MIDRLKFAGNSSNKIQGYKFWQDGYHVEQIFTIDFYRQKLNYIHMNPVRQEFVKKPEYYLYSSAQDYSGIKGLLDVDIIN